MKAILPNLWQVCGDGFTASADAAGYLIRFGNTAALVDAGTGKGYERLIRNIEQCLSPDVSLKYLLLTHCHFDHTGGAEGVRAHFGCQIVAHALDAEFLEAGNSQVTAADWYGQAMTPLSIDWKLGQNKTVIAMGKGKITALHWPGHSPGSVVYYTRINNQTILFGQDVHGPIHSALLSDAKQYQASLKILLDLDADILLEGHFGIFRGKVQVKRFIESYMQI